MDTDRRPWYAPEGLRFECRSDCARCCRGEPGHVFLTLAERERLARRLEVTEEEFRRRWCVRIGRDAWSLNERSNGDCVFLDADYRCSVYEDRPRQCSSYPFWRQILANRSAWERESRECPGINRGRLIPPEEIARRAVDPLD